MKKILLSLLFTPMFLTAQTLDGSLSLGPVVHNFIAEDYYGAEAKKNLSYNLSVSGMIKLPYGLRAGLSVSYLKLGFEFHDNALFVPVAYKVYINPVLFECIVLSRNNFRHSNLDFGIMAGLCGNRQITSRALDGHLRDHITKYRRYWYTYGISGTYQYHITKRYALGVDVQAKMLTGLAKKIFVLPVAIKGSIRI